MQEEGIQLEGDHFEEGRGEYVAYIKSNCHVASVSCSRDPATGDVIISIGGDTDDPSYHEHISQAKAALADLRSTLAAHAVKPTEPWKPPAEAAPPQDLFLPN